METSGPGEGIAALHHESVTDERPVPPSSPRPRRTWPNLAWGLGVAILVIVVAVGSFALGRVSAPDEAGPETAAAETTSQETPPTTGVVATDDFRDEPVVVVSRTLEPSVVQIETPDGLGSGVVYDSSGLILTAAHVIGSSEDVVVQLSDGTRIDGKVVGTDDESDIGVVRVSYAQLVAAPLALGEELDVGQMAIAIGSPFGLEQSVTAGVVSATSRAVVSPDGAVRQLIQTDAPINPGNSGGALADRSGKVIGINDQIVTQSGGNEGVGFAIPIDRAKRIADALVAGTPIEQAFLGVKGTDPELGAGGAVITEVVPGSAAADSGLEVDDLVTAVDDTPVTSFTELAGVVRSLQPGDRVTLTVLRSGEIVRLTATLTGQ